MDNDFAFDENEQLDIFNFMDESEQDKQLYENDTNVSIVSVDMLNSLCQACENCQYRATVTHTKELKCTMFDCDMHRTFSECKGYTPAKKA